jgi:hypothetical protein|tara:strand:+ start:828 stop:1034 length:207 start_codon:yes stop_codon:yes gene_type:complete
MIVDEMKLNIITAFSPPKDFTGLVETPFRLSPWSVWVNGQIYSYTSSRNDARAKLTLAMNNRNGFYQK